MFAGRRWTARRSCRATAPRRATTPRRPYSCRTSRPNKPCRRTHEPKPGTLWGRGAPWHGGGVCYVHQAFLACRHHGGWFSSRSAGCSKEKSGAVAGASSLWNEIARQEPRISRKSVSQLQFLGKEVHQHGSKTLERTLELTSSIDLEAALCPAFATCLHPARACGVSLLPPTPRITWKSCRQTTGVFTSSSARRVFGEAFVATHHNHSHNTRPHTHTTRQTLHYTPPHDTTPRHNQQPADQPASSDATQHGASSAPSGCARPTAPGPKGSTGAAASRR